MARDVINFGLRAQDRTRGAFNSVASRFGILQKRGVLAGAAIGAGIAGGAVVAGKALLDIGQTFEGVENTLRTATGATGEALDGLVESARNVGSNVPQDFQMIAATLGELNTAFGFTGEQLEMAGQHVLDFARVTGVDAASAANDLGSILKTFGEDDLAGVLDAVTVAGQATGVTAQQLISDFRTYGPVLANAGLSTDETAAFFAKLNEQGIDASRIMPGINAAMRNLAAEGVTDLRGGLISQFEAIQNATTESEALNLATETFGAEGAQRMLSALRSGELAINDIVSGFGGPGGLIDNIEMSSGAAAQLAEDNLTLSDRFDILKNRATAAIAPVAERVLDLATQFLDKLLPAIDVIIEFIRDTAIPWLRERLAPAFENIRTVVQRLADFWEKIWPFLRVVFETFGRLLLERIETLFSIIGKVFGAFAAILSGDWGKLWDNIRGIFTDFGKFFLNSWSILWDGVVKLFAAAGIDLPGVWRKVANTVLGITEGMVNGVIRFINGFIGAVEAIPNGILSIINTVIDLINSVPSIEIPAVKAGPITIFPGATIGLPKLSRIGGDGVSLGRIAEISLPRLTAPPVGAQQAAASQATIDILDAAARRREGLSPTTGRPIAGEAGGPSATLYNNLLAGTLSDLEQIDRVIDRQAGVLTRRPDEDFVPADQIDHDSTASGGPATRRSRGGGGGGTVINITIEGDIFGVDDLEERIVSAVNAASRAGTLAPIGG